MDRELWNKVQDILSGRYENRTKRPKRHFTYTGLIRCGHCGCSLVAQLQKGKYVYYHCSGAKGKCPEPYTREEVLDDRLGAVLDALRFDDEVLEWVTQALRLSHDDEKRYHEEAVARLRAEYDRLQQRIDAMYVDKLDGRIDAAFFDRKSAEWRSEQQECLATIARHQNANQTYFDEGVQLLELAQKAGEMFRTQPSNQKRRLLGFVLSNCTWEGGELTATYRQPFDLLAKNVLEFSQRKRSGEPETAISEIWLPFVDAYRTFCIAPSTGVIATFDAIRVGT